MLPKLLLDRMKSRDLSLRDAAKEIGISHTTVSRMLNGEATDIDTLDAVARWLGVPLTSLIELRDGSSEDTISQIQVLLGMQPELKPVFREVYEKIISGEIDSNALGDILHYAEYRLKSKPK